MKNKKRIIIGGSRRAGKKPASNLETKKSVYNLPFETTNHYLESNRDFIQWQREESVEKLYKESLQKWENENIHTDKQEGRITNL
jgi:hypothetical protein